jgi:hypothetical protein
MLGDQQGSNEDLDKSNKLDAEAKRKAQ